MKLIIEPDDGVTPLVRAIKNAKKAIDIVIFRFDRPELEKALESAERRRCANSKRVCSRWGLPFRGPQTICRATTAR